MIDFDDIFHPTEEQKRKQIEQVNYMIRKSIEDKGECCDNCKHMEYVNAGHGFMDCKCKKTRKWIKETVRCEHYEFCGFIEATKQSKRKRKSKQLPGQIDLFDVIDNKAE